MKKIGKKSLLVGGMAALLALSACESKEKKAAREAAAERERAAAIERARAEAKLQEENLTDAIYDSLMNVPNTIDGMSAEQADKLCRDFNYGNGKGTKHELDSLSGLNMAVVLHKKVESSGKPIAEKHLKELFASLSTYNLGVDVDAKIKELLSGTVDFYGSEASDTIYGYDEFEWHQGDFVYAVLSGADTAKYGASRQAEIVKIVKNRYVKMMAELKKNRIAVAKQFADYYPILDLDRIPKQYRKYFAEYDPAVTGGEGWMGYSYPGSWLMRPSFAIEKSVSVYDSKLKPEFFNVPGAQYKLVRVANGKWQVIRTLKDKIEKTPVFAHNVDYTSRLNAWDIEGVKQGDSHFYAEAGANLGVHIYVTEYEYVVHAAKSDKLPDPNGERAARIAQLEQQQAHMDSLQHASWEYSRRARECASQLAIKRLGRNR